MISGAMPLLSGWMPLLSFSFDIRIPFSDVSQVTGLSDLRDG